MKTIVRFLGFMAVAAKTDASLARVVSDLDWKTSVSGLCDFTSSRVTSMFLIRYLFQHRLESAVDERTGVMFKSRVTFQLKCTLRGCVPWTNELTDVAVKIESAAMLSIQAKRRMRRENVTREREREKKWIHGIADPLTKLSLTITAGGINTGASVRAGEAAGGGRRARGSHASHAALRGKPREEVFNWAFSGKTWSCAAAGSHSSYSPPGAYN